MKSLPVHSVSKMATIAIIMADKRLKRLQKQNQNRSKQDKNKLHKKT